MIKKAIIYDSILTKKTCLSYDQKKLLKLRKQVHDLFFIKGLSKNAIVRKKAVSKHFVIKWTKPDLKEEDFATDNRGWSAGNLRKWNQQTLNRIKELHAEIKSDPHRFYCSATVIDMLWRDKYP